LQAAVVQEARTRAERAASEQGLHAAEIKAVKTSERLDHLRLGHAAILMRGALTVANLAPSATSVIEFRRVPQTGQGSPTVSAPRIRIAACPSRKMVQAFAGLDGL